MNGASSRWGFLLRRVGAYVIDVGLAFGAFALVQTVLFPLVSGRYEALLESGWLLELYVLATISLPVWLYFILTERSAVQATVGKRLLGLRVTDVSGGRPTVGQVVLRTFGKLLPWELAHFSINVPVNVWLNPDTEFGTWRFVPLGLVYLLLIVYFVSIVQQPQRAVYDRVVGTKVVG